MFDLPLRRVLALAAVLLLLVAACAPDEDPAAEAPDDGAEDEDPVDEDADEDADGDADEPEDPDADEGLALDPVEEVRIAYVPIMKFATAYVAEQRGHFEDLGLDVTFEQVASGTEAIAFLEEGTVDLGGIALVASTWNAWDAGIDLRVIAPGGLEPEADSPTKLMARSDLVEDGEVEEVADLEGRTVAVAGGPGSGGEYLLTRALEEGGLGFDDVDVQDLGNPEMPASFEAEAIDAALVGSPYADQAESAGHAAPLLDLAEAVPGAMTVAFVGSASLVEERPEVAERLALGLLRAAEQMQGEDYLADENIEAYLEFVDTTEEDLREGEPVVYDPEQDIPVDGLDDIERVHRENGRVEYEEPIDADEVVDTSFVEWARDAADE